jgi:hypothetical protein
LRYASSRDTLWTPSILLGIRLPTAPPRLPSSWRRAERLPCPPPAQLHPLVVDVSLVLMDNWRVWSRLPIHGWASNARSRGLTGNKDCPPRHHARAHARGRTRRSEADQGPRIPAQREAPLALRGPGQDRPAAGGFDTQHRGEEDAARRSRTTVHSPLALPMNAPSGILTRHL